jgi:hypothetical protein
MSSMTNLEILAEIERLKTLLKRPEPEDGQVWMTVDGSIYFMVTTIGYKKFLLVNVSGHASGGRWSDDGFGVAGPDAFIYVGMFDELFVRKP